MVIAKVFIKAVEFDGPPKTSDFKLVEEEIGDLAEEEILVEAEYLSVDPYQRAFPIPVGSAMIGSQVGLILESKNKDYPKGEYIVGYFGWRTHTKLVPEIKDERSIIGEIYKLSEFTGFPRTYALGILGMPGVTAYLGLEEIIQPKTGETLVVTAAAGAVGSIVGQIAKIYRLKVIGITGSDEKCEWIKNELDFDHAINYKTANLEAELKAAAPNGVDCYFDNVGGKISSCVISQMNKGGRIAVCGSISSYNSKPENWEYVPPVQPHILFKQLKMEGFEVTRWSGTSKATLLDIYALLKHDAIKTRETITEGFDNIPKAFIEMLNGANIGKAIVKV